MPDMLPLDVIAGFERAGEKNTNFDWERLLEIGYRRFLTPESVVIDIGGHAGRHAAVFIEDIGCRRVMIFEPLPAQRKFLITRFQAHSEVQILPYALSASNGTAEFVVNEAAPEESGLKERIYNDPGSKRLRRITVETSRLDDLTADLQAVDYIKIDTEGAEVDIIHGAESLLARCKPILSIEYGQPGYSVYGYTRWTLFDLLESLDYVLLDLFGNPFDRDQWDNVIDRFYWDFFAAPSEQVDSFRAKLGTAVFDGLERCRVGQPVRPG
jgi:FkbM family methyltransferase